MYNKRQNSRGFSLVELSIVLVILGLLVGGILGGQSLIHAAELRSVNTELETWRTAVNTFRSRYFQLPGDFTKAEDFWGAASTCPATLGSVVDDGVCNGNGNGQIGNQAGGYIPERFMFWLELSKAGLIPGKYSGAAGAENIYRTNIGTNVPASKYNGTGWSIFWWNDLAAGDGNWFAGDYGNAHIIGAQSTNSVSSAAFPPEDAWNIDTKYDDGKPGQGMMVVRLWNSCTLADDNEDFEAEYDLSKDSVECALVFRKLY